MQEIREHESARRRRRNEAETRGAFAVPVAALLAVVAAALAAPAPARALHPMLATYRTGLDVGNNASTGCPFDLGSIAPGSLPGFELELTVVVDTSRLPPLVVSAEIARCEAGAFVDPEPLAGFTFDLDNGPAGSDSLVGSIPRDLLGSATSARLAHHTETPEGAEDALFTLDGTPSGAAILTLFPQTIPALSTPGAVLAALLLAGAAFAALRRRRGGSDLPRRPTRAGSLALCLAVLLAAQAGVAQFAATTAVDAAADASIEDSRAELLSASATPSDTALEVSWTVENLDILRATIYSHHADRFVVADETTGLLSATLAVPALARAHFALAVDSGTVVIQNTASNLHAIGHAPVLPETKVFVFADAVTPAAATQWVIFVGGASTEIPEGLEAIILQAGPPSPTVPALLFDPATDNLHIVDSDLPTLVSDPNSSFVLTALGP